MVGNIDDTPELEIIVSGIAQGPLYAWKPNGMPVPGWPVSVTARTGYPAMGKFTAPSGRLDVFAGFAGGRLAAIRGDGSVLPGWPRQAGNYVAMPPAMADIDGNGLDEAFVCEQDYTLRMYRADGSSTVMGITNYVQSCNTPTIADINSDGQPEIIFTSGAVSSGVELHATTNAGYTVPGFPVIITYGSTAYSFPVVGDVDGDGVVDIVVVVHEDSYPWRPLVKIFRGDGTLKRTIVGTGTMYYGATPALADLDGDRKPEIVFQTHGAINVFRGDGTSLPEWPVEWDISNTAPPANAHPVVGDVDGDWRPDVVVVRQDGVRVYSADGKLHPRFPKSLSLGDGAVPAIADINLDGRNEIIVTGSFWNGVADYYDKVWVYDLGGSSHGPVQWGQFNGGPGHRGVYLLYPLGSTNVAPVANAGSDKTVLARTNVVLDGTQSNDADGQIVRASWRQVSGKAVLLTNANSLTVQFTAPAIKGTESPVLIFDLTVTDNDGATRSDQVTVTVVK